MPPRVARPAARSVGSFARTWRAPRPASTTGWPSPSARAAAKAGETIAQPHTRRIAPRAASGPARCDQAHRRAAERRTAPGDRGEHVKPRGHEPRARRRALVRRDQIGDCVDACEADRGQAQPYAKAEPDAQKARRRDHRQETPPRARRSARAGQVPAPQWAASSPRTSPASRPETRRGLARGPRAAHAPTSRQGGLWTFPRFAESV